MGRRVRGGGGGGGRDGGAKDRVGVWLERLEKLQAFLERHDPERRFRFSGRLRERFERLADSIKDAFIDETVREDLRVSLRWVRVFRATADEAVRELGLRGVSLPREFKSFVEDPRAHLRKKLFNYFYDLLRGKITLDIFVEKGRAALTTSLKTNMRSIYQYWCFLSMVTMLNRRYGPIKIVYPEHGYIPLDRWGKQRTQSIPPNLSITLGERALSLFIEAPRPIGWGDTRDLRRAWSLYTSLRPDLLVYGGVVLDIVRLGSEPPILKPDLIIEFKELPDWYKRAREVKGPLARPLSAEEWRSRWIEGLWTGLADILGVKRAEVAERVTPRGVRLRETQLVALYKKIYEPKELLVVSRTRTPKEVKKDLRDVGITVIDNVGFRVERLSNVVDSIAKFAEPIETVTITLSGETLHLLHRYMSIRNIQSFEDAIKDLLRRALST